MGQRQEPTARVPIIVSDDVESLQSEKSRLRPTPLGRSSSATSWRWLACLLFIAALVRLAQIQIYHGLSWRTSSSPTRDITSQCVQADPLAPPLDDALDSSLEYLNSASGKARSASLLSRAVQIDTSTYDDTGPVTGDLADPRWKVFEPFRGFLQHSFPTVYDKAKSEVIHEHALLYTIEGSDPKRKPVVLMAHQDVVPVDPATSDDWTHPPFSGAIKDGSVWGRGSCDCKSQLMGILTALEALLKAGFAPARTLVLSFGFDEETTGFNGAGALAKELFSRYGEDGIEMILDEGGEMSTRDGKPWASIDVTEHGYLDVNITIRTPGGHSSIPPSHTGIGLLASLITDLEAKPFKPDLVFSAYSGSSSAPKAENPYFEGLQCRLAHAPASIPGPVRSAITKAPFSSSSLRSLLAWVVAPHGDDSRYFVQTSQAVDVIRGGVKVNALPEVTSALVNYRIDVSSSVRETQRRLTTDIFAPFAERFDLTLDAFDQGTIVVGSKGRASVVTVRGFGPLDPAPVSPATVDDPRWRLLAGTTRQVFGDDSVVAPGLEGGNTDTQFYWNLTSAIYRFTPTPDDGSCRNIHTVDERITIDGHARTVAFFHTFLRNAGAM